MNKKFLSNPFSTKLAKKMLLVLLTCSLLPIFSISIISYIFVRQYLQNAAASEMRRNSFELIQNLNQQFTNCQSTFSNIVKLKAKLPNILTVAEKQTVQKQATVLFDFIALQQGKNIEYIEGAPSAIPNLSEADHKALTIHQSLFKLDILNNKPNFFILSKIGNQLYIGKVNNSKIFESFVNLCKSWDCNCIIYTKNSQVIYSQDIPSKYLSQFLSEFEKPHTNYFSLEQTDKSFLCIKKPLPLQPFFTSKSNTIVLFKNQNLILSPLYTFNKYFSIILLINIITVLLLCIYIVRRYNSHIEKLYKATNEIAQRNFSHKVHITSKDEFESLANSFNDMTEYLQQTTLSKNHLAKTLRSIADGIIVSDIDKKVILMNKAAQDLTGWSEEKAEGQPISQVLQLYKNNTLLDSQALLNEVFNSKMDSPLPTDGADLKQRDGSKSIVAYNITPIVNDNNYTSGAVFVIRDMTKQAEMESQMRQMQKMEAIGTMAGGIAHDFNNILGVILGYLELAELHLKPTDKEIKENLIPIQQAAVRAQSLVQQILTFSRQKVLEKQPVLLTTLVKEVSKMLRSTIPSSISIRTRFSVKHAKILADPTQIHQVLMNLCTNAYHAMRTSGTGTLTVALQEINNIPTSILQHYRTKDDCNYVLLSVSDTGHGIPQDYLERIFDPYFTTKKKGEGTGLGLATVKGIIEELGGIINVSSAPGFTSFDLYFPLLEDEGEEEVEAIQKELPKGNSHILLVDDDQDLIKTSSKMLEFLGYKVTAMTNSIEALHFFRQHASSIDLVITDQTMPFLTGTHLCKKILKIRGDIPLILCTGFSDSIDEDSIKATGIHLLIYKPFNINLLANALYSLLHP